MFRILFAGFDDFTFWQVIQKWTNFVNDMVIF
jgi:hypothetical protein